MKESHKIESEFGKFTINKIGDVWYLKKTIQEKQREVSLKTPSKIQAESTAKRILEMCQTSPYSEVLNRVFGSIPMASPMEMTVDAFIEKYEQFCNESEKAPSATTQRQVKNYLKLIAKKTKSVTLADLSRVTFTDFKKLYPNPVSLNSALRQCKAIFKISVLKWLKAKGIDITNPFDHIDTAKVQIKPYSPLDPKIRIKMEKESKKLPDTQKMIFLLAYKCGMRRGEIDKSRLAWITKTDNGGLFKIKSESDFDPKSRQERQFPIKKELMEEILTLRGNSESEYLIPGSHVERTNKTGEKGRQKAHGNYRLQSDLDAILEWLKKYNLELHELRKECGSYLSSTYGTFYSASILGHDENINRAYYSSATNLPTLG